MRNKLFSFVLMSLLLIGIVSASYSPVQSVFDFDNGNVGIGTTGPLEALDINGTLQFGNGKDYKLINADSNNMFPVIFGSLDAFFLGVLYG